MGPLPAELPSLAWPAVPATLDTLRFMLPYAPAMAAVGLLESLLTAWIVDGITDTGSEAPRVRGAGGANVVAGLVGGMGRCRCRRWAR